MLSDDELKVIGAGCAALSPTLKSRALLEQALSHIDAQAQEIERLKARVAELENALRQHLHTNRACSRPIGQEGSHARMAWEDQVEADRVAAAALAQETKP